MADHDRLLHGLWRDRFHAEPTCIELSPPHVQQRLETVWDPGRLLREQIAPLPSGMLRLWHRTPRGHIVFTHQPSRYVPGPQTWRDRPLEAVCYLRVADLLDKGGAAFLTCAQFVDHLLGSAAQEDGGRFSAGHGISPRLAEAARRYVRDEKLGYGHSELGVASPSAYFGRCLWLYLTDRQRLNVLDPNIHRLFAGTLFEPDVWEMDG